MGRIGDRKGTFELMTDSKIEPDERSSLYILGDEDGRSLKLVDKLQLEGAVVVGWVSNQEKFEIIRRCSAVILPSKNKAPIGFRGHGSWPDSI